VKEVIHGNDHWYRKDLGEGVSIASLGLKKADTTIRRRLIINVVGKEKQGKTNFGLTAPGPIILFDLDYGLEGVVSKFAGTKAIYPSEYRINEISPAHFLSTWERFKKEFGGALKEKEVRSVIVDTGTEMWELIRLARFGKLTQVMPQHYGPVNSELRGLIRDAYSSDKNLIILHKMTEIYKNNQPTGEFGMAGFKDIPYNVQVNLLCWRDTDGTFHATINDCRQNSDLAGMDLIGDMVNFPTLASLVFPATEEGDCI
jgi:hypothetical protein